MQNNAPLCYESSPNSAAGKFQSLMWPREIVCSYGAWGFIAVFTEDGHWNLSWSCSFQSTLSNHITIIIIEILCCYPWLVLASPSWSLPTKLLYEFPFAHALQYPAYLPVPECTFFMSFHVSWDSSTWRVPESFKSWQNWSAKMVLACRKAIIFTFVSYHCHVYDMFLVSNTCRRADHSGQAV